jgi:DNA-binding NarL/FixJ family response regulator
MNVTPEPETAESYRLVIVEDHELLRRGLAASLNKKWIIIGEAADLAEARDVFTTLDEKPDLILLDISLRDKEWGLELLPDLAEKYGEKEKPPTLIYSMYSDYAHVKTAFSMGAQGYISKAEGLAELETAMDTVVHGQVYVEKRLIAKLTTVPELTGSLTRREKEIFLMTQQGLNNHHIADKLGLALRSVENYINRIYDKLGVKTRRELQDL